MKKYLHKRILFSVGHLPALEGHVLEAVVREVEDIYEREFVRLDDRWFYSGHVTVIGELPAVAAAPEPAKKKGLFGR